MIMPVDVLGGLPSRLPNSDEILDNLRKHLFTEVQAGRMELAEATERLGKAIRSEKDFAAVKVVNRPKLPNDIFNLDAWQKKINSDMVDALSYATITGQNTAANPSPAAMTREDNMRLLAMRMRWKSGQLFPFQFVDCYVSDKVAHVFVTHKDQAVILEDDPALFPSDKLIASLRVMLG